jgi:hypothetical protein
MIKMVELDGLPEKLEEFGRSCIVLTTNTELGSVLSPMR